MDRAGLKEEGVSTPILRTALLLAALVLSAPAPPAAPKAGTTSSPRTVQLTMTDQMTFDPARIQVRRGETVRFVVRNVSNEAHEAYIGTEEEQRCTRRCTQGWGPVTRQRPPTWVTESTSLPSATASWWPHSMGRMST